MIDRFIPDIGVLIVAIVRTFVLSQLIDHQYLLNEAINRIAVFSPNNVIFRGIRYNIHQCD